MATLWFSTAENTELRDNNRVSPTTGVDFAIIDGQDISALAVPEYSGGIAMVDGEFTLTDASITVGDKTVLIKDNLGPKLGAYKLTAT